MDAGRARGRSRGRGRGDDQQEEAGVRRPGDQPPFQQPQPSGGYGRGPPVQVTPAYEAPGPGQVSVPGGRATRTVHDPIPPDSAGRAAPHGRAPTATAPLASQEVGDQTRPSMGRGASRGREQREAVIFTRPSIEFIKMGREGEPCPVAANYFELTSRPDFHLLQYRVDFAPELDHMGVRKALVRQHEQVLGKYLFDGTLLYNVTRLPQPMTVNSLRNSDNSTVAITFRLVGEIQKEDAIYTNVMNIILRRCLHLLQLTMLKRDYFDPAMAQDIPQHSLTIWPGYLTSVRHHEDGFLLGVEIIHKVLRRDTAMDVMNRIRQQGGDFQSQIKAELEGKVVMTHYNKKTYRIDDIDFTMNPMSVFHLRKEDRDVTYVEYYRTRYEVEVRNVSQPLLVSRPSRRDLNRGDDQPVFLIPELCGMTGLSDSQKANFNLMKDVGTITRVNPDKRVEALMKFRRRIADNTEIQRELNSWGLQFSQNLVQCKGRIMRPYEILQGGANYTPQEGDWSRNIQRSRMSVTVVMTDWAVFHPQNMGQEIQAFVKMIQQVGRGQNFNVPDPRYISMVQDRTSNYVDSMRDECRRQEYNMVMAVLRAARADTYASIKKLTYHECGIPSQVITGRNLKGQPGKLMSIATKVMIQLAAKLGAEPWQVSVPQTSWMVCGYDTYHDAKQRKAVGAFVASTNKEFTRYFSSVKIHENNEEISPSFKDHVVSALRKYYGANRALPSKIIIYRDGVGSGDIARLKETEVAAVKSACNEVPPSLAPYTPGIAFIVVSKRINTRFFGMGRGPPSNPRCGTVVDNTVTLSERYDFFLVSQKVTQGTVSPTSFNIVEDSSAISPDIQQRLAYALTHLYYNWPGTLRVPAPIQYAHKLAYLVGESIMQTPHERLCLLPYYL